MKQRILITGSNGFLGRHILSCLLETFTSDIKVMAFIRSEPAIKWPEVDYVLGRLPDDIPFQISEFDPHVVIHLASSLKDNILSGYREVNVKGTEKLLQQMGPSLKQVFYNSSASVYGQGPFLKGVQENQKASPQTDLALSRYEAECVVQDYCSGRGVNGFVIRPRFLIGHDDQSTLPSWLKMSKMNLRFGSETQDFSYIDVDDYAKIICHLITKVDEFDSRCEVLNMAYEYPVSLKEILQRLSPQRKNSFLIRLPLSTLIRGLSLLKRGKTLTKFELIGQHQRLSTEKLKTYCPPARLQNNSHDKLDRVLKEYLEKQNVE